MRPGDYQDFYTDESNLYHLRRYGGLYGTLFRTLHHETLAELLEKISANDFVLEVACGTGHTTSLLSDMGVRPITCDLTPAMMNRARQLTADKPARPDFLQVDARQLPFADNTFDILISTRFLHLFHHDVQQSIITEMYRVLKHGGQVIIDFDNWSSRWIMMIPHFIYNVIKYHRLAPFSIYNRINYTRDMVQNVGIDVQTIKGVGGTHLALLAALNQRIALRAGRAHKNNPLRVFAEQFVVSGIKQ